MPTDPETAQAIILRLENRLVPEVDAMMARLNNLYLIGKALPHPYDAIGKEACDLLHDFAQVGSHILTYKELRQTDRESARALGAKEN